MSNERRNAVRAAVEELHYDSEQALFDAELSDREWVMGGRQRTARPPRLPRPKPTWTRSHKEDE